MRKHVLGVVAGLSKMQRVTISLHAGWIITIVSMWVPAVVAHGAGNVARSIVGSITTRSLERSL